MYGAPPGYGGGYGGYPGMQPMQPTYGAPPGGFAGYGAAPMNGGGYTSGFAFGASGGGDPYSGGGDPYSGMQLNPYQGLAAGAFGGGVGSSPFVFTPSPVGGSYAPPPTAAREPYSAMQYAAAPPPTNYAGQSGVGMFQQPPPAAVHAPTTRGVHLHGAAPAPPVLHGAAPTVEADPDDDPNRLPTFVKVRGLPVEHDPRMVRRKATKKRAPGVCCA